MNETVLVVEDDETLRSTVVYSLQREGFRPLAASDGAAALALVRTHPLDLVILDLMIPKIDGFGVLDALGPESAASVVVLTALTDEHQKIKAFSLGAGDYVTKPFGMHELLARVKALARRRRPPISVDAGRDRRNLQIDRAGRLVRKAQLPIPMSRKEFDLLAFLADTPGRVFTREELLDQVWGDAFHSDRRTVDVHIRWLRLKIEDDPHVPRRIETVRGVGYRYADEQSSREPPW